MPDKLSTKQQRAIISLLSEPSIEAAALDASVNPATIHRWKKDKKFRQALEAAEIEALGTAARLLSQSAARASKYLDGVIDDPKATISEKIRAAQIILERMPQIRYVGSFEDRLRKLFEVINV